MLPPFWDYRREYDELREEILAAVDRVFKSGQLILGPEGVAFERDMAAYIGVAGGVGVSSGTDAIYIALAAAGVTAGDEVITVPNTAVPTVSAIQILGARPVFVDIRDDDFLMDVSQIEQAITPRMRAIVPVHLYGQCVDLDPLMDIAKRHGLKVIEDCAQSQGSLYRNRRCGSIGTASTFSFYPTKLLGGYGDGGMVLSDDAAVVALAQSLRFYGMEKTYYAERHGYNSRLDASLALEPKDPAELLDWLEARRKEVPLSAELIPLSQVAGRHQADNGNIGRTTGQFFRIEGVRVKSASGVREVSGWDQPIFTQSEGGILALLCRETAGRGIEFLLQAKADPGNIGYLQLCPTIQSTLENHRGLKGAKRPLLAECLDPSENIRVVYRSKHNEEGSRFWQKSNENMILFANDTSRLAIDERTYRWASLSQIKQMILLDDVVGPYVRTVVAPL